MNLILLLFLGALVYICLAARGVKKYAAMFICVGLLLLAVFLFDGGTRIDGLETPQQSGAGETMHAVFLFGGTRVHDRDSQQAEAPRTLRVLAREGGLPHEIYQQLEASTGITVEETTYANEQEFDTLMQSGQEFDVAFVADYLALRMKRTGDSLRINYKKVPNAATISPRIAKYGPFRPLFGCSVPYLFTTLSIGYNRFYFDDLPQSWEEFFQATQLKKMRGYVVLNDEMRNMLGLILKAQGDNPNSSDSAQVRLAGKHMMEVMDAALPSIGNEELLADGSVYLGVAWSYEMARAMEENPEVRFANADEGSVVALECFSIMQSCQDEDAAYEFINYLYQPKVAAKVTNLTYRASLSDAAKAYVRPEILNGPSYFFPEDDAVIFRDDLAERDAIYEEVWADVMAHYQTVVLPQREDELVLRF